MWCFLMKLFTEIHISQHIFNKVQWICSVLCSLFSYFSTVSKVKSLISQVWLFIWHQYELRPDSCDLWCKPCRESKIASSEKMRIGGTAEMAWMQICDPSDREKGHYSIEISDGVKTHTRTFDLSGQGKQHSNQHFFYYYCYFSLLLTLSYCKTFGN